MTKDRWRATSAKRMSLLALMAGSACAQPVDPGSSSATAPPLTLDAINAVAPDEAPPVDLYGFRNPVIVEPNAFDKAWQPPPTVEQISLAGGYIEVGIGLGLLKAGQALHTATGGRAQIQPATARPPPLDAAQLRRATQACEACEACDAVPAASPVGSTGSDEPDELGKSGEPA